MKPSIPKGTRDITPAMMVRRNYIFKIISDAFQRFGFSEIQTPAFENLNTLTGKYGDEGDKLIFKILNSGNWLESLPIKKETLNDFFNRNYADKYSGDEVPAFSLIAPLPNAKHVSEKALRYDLTVPFARYVVMHQNEITFPFKRYQIQPVWRADRPQKGRYREFFQCDADIIGSTSLLNEVELIMLIDEVFATLGIKVKILINNRKILSGIAEEIGAAEKFNDLIYSLDNLDKLGDHGVGQELLKRGFTFEQVEQVSKYIRSLNERESDSYLSYSNIFPNSEIGRKGLEELNEIRSYFGRYSLNGLLSQEGKVRLKNKLQVDISLARGLDYYTGAIFEVKIDDERSSFKSSVLGGGRYDDLTGIFGLPNTSGVGISFGADRIYDVLEEANLFPQGTDETTKVLIINFGGDEIPYALQIAKTLREAGINTELYPDAAKMKKQMSYADSRKIPYVILAGSDERNALEVTLKDMRTSQQEKIKLSDLISKIN